MYIEKNIYTKKYIHKKYKQGKTYRKRLIKESIYKKKGCIQGGTYIQKNLNKEKYI